MSIGGGPGGLYAAYLLKRARPSWDVVVLERNQPGETFGFGVVFSEPTLDGLRDADVATYERLIRGSMRWDPIEVRLRGEAVRCSGQGFAAIGRKALLDLLTREAMSVGVEFHFGTTVDPTALPDADVIIAADGARSSIRKWMAPHFEPTIEAGSTRYIWFATTRRFDCLTFLFEKNEHGSFAVHAYPYDEKASTFIVETDDPTWRAAGLDHSTTPEKEDVRSSTYCERLFARSLEGHPLLSNRSYWSTFRTVRTETWHHEKVVLIGDAAHTAHFSVGSGTKMALEDALALARALTATDDVEAAFRAYEAERRPRVRKLQGSARPSLFWWEHFGDAMEQAIEPFAFRFLTRNYRVTRESLLKRDVSFVERTERWFASASGASVSRPVEASIHVRGVDLPSRIVRDGGAEQGAALVLLRPSELAGAPPPEGVKRGARMRAAELASGARLPDVGWLDVEIDDVAEGGRVIADVRKRWEGPLSARLRVSREPLEEFISAASTIRNAGADVLTVVPAAGREVWALLCAEAERFPRRAPLMLACTDALADTLLLSERADLCLVNEAPGNA